NSPGPLFFMIAAPDGPNDTSLAALARHSGMLRKEEVRKLLLAANSEDEVLEIINEHDQEEETVKGVPTGGHTIVAVTACPTGIAHTYMAADALKAKAEEMGVSIKVETNGSGGAKNVLTKEDIKNATAVIIAADTKVDTNRFIGKHVIQAPVA